MTKPVSAEAATIHVLHGAPILPALVAALAGEHVGAIHLVGDAPITDLDVQQSRHYRRDDVGRRPSEVLRERVLAGTRTALTASDGLPATKLAWQERLSGATFAVALVPGPIPFTPWLEHVNEAALDLGLAWMSAALLDGKELHVGPTVVPGQTACFRCYEMRYKSNLSHFEAYQQFEAHTRTLSSFPDFGLLPPIAEVVAGLVASEVARFHTPGGRPVSWGKLLTFDTNSFVLETHPVLKLPRCASCSPAVNAPDARSWRSP
jgi:bacteriocin biosynthesis cyclodehydratase domain-containing protein